MTEKEKNQNNVHELKKQTNQRITPKGSEFDVCVCFFSIKSFKEQIFPMLHQWFPNRGLTSSHETKPLTL